MIKLVTLATASTLALAVPALANDPGGVWQTEGGRAQVRVAPCGSAICGTIISLKEPNDPSSGRPKTDKNNADQSKRARPMVGVQIVMGMKPNGANKWSGQVYNAEDGKTYSGHLTLESSSRIKLEGCALGGMVCKASYWTR